MGWHGSFRGTRAGVLIAPGKLDEGIPLAKDALLRNEWPEHRAFTACDLALAWQAKGRTGEGLRYLQMAETLDPNCRRLARARQACEREIPMQHNKPAEGPL